MMNTKELIIAELQKLMPEVRERYRVNSLALFGSLARGEQQEESDIDLLVEFGAGATLFDLVGLSLYLEEKLHRKVDVVPRESLRRELRDTVFKDLVTV